MSRQSTDTTEFNQEFVQHTNKVVRGRLVLFLSVWGGLGVLINTVVYGLVAAQWLGRLPPELRGLGTILPGFGAELISYSMMFGFWAAGYTAALVWLVTGRVPTGRALKLSLAVITLDGLVAVVARASGVPAPFPVGLVLFYFSHFVASLIFPWSAKQALWPAGLVLGVSAISRLTVESGPPLGVTLTGIALSPLGVVPALLVCMARHSRRLERFGYSFVRQRYGRLRADLTSARIIHEGLFPAPRTTGPVRARYRYEPMRQIGGDYLHMSVSPGDGGGERLSLVLLDVTGHGVTAALSVNRLHGEIELMFADEPGIPPDRVLRRLNRYVHLTLIKHSVYVTGICLRVDTASGKIEHASGGHPPAFLRGVDGTIEELGPTSTLLGALPDERYDAAMEVRPFGPGDSVVAYTDGATEARCPDGRMLGIQGLRTALTPGTRSEPGAWSDRLLDSVVGYRGGLAPEDDTLVVEIYRPLVSRVESAADGAASGSGVVNGAQGGAAAGRQTRPVSGPASGAASGPASEPASGLAP